MIFLVLIGLPLLVVLIHCLISIDRVHKIGNYNNDLINYTFDKFGERYLDEQWRFDEMSRLIDQQWSSAHVNCVWRPIGKPFEELEFLQVEKSNKTKS